MKKKMTPTTPEAAIRLLQKYPDHVPVLATATRLLNSALTKQRFLCPRDMTVGQFQAKIRQHLPGITSATGVFLIFGDKCVCAAATRMAQVYTENRGHDLFLHVTVTGENTFG
jgi:hypothetical protein